MTRQWNLLRRIGSALLAALLLCHAATPASATGIHTLQTLICTGNITATYSPALTSTTQNVTITSTTNLGQSANPLGACIVVGAPITSGSNYSQFTVPSSCDVLLNTDPAGGQYTWNTGAISAVSFTTAQRNRYQATTVIILAGSVVVGFGNGNTITATFTMLNTDLDACATTGITQLNGLVTLTIT